MPRHDARLSFLRWGGCALLIVAALSGGVVFAQKKDSLEQAELFLRQGQYAEALRALAAVTAEDPQRAEAQLLLGRALIKLGRLKEAEAALLRYTDAKPRSDDGIYLLAYVLFRQGRAIESLKLYGLAASIKDPSPDDWKIIGLNYGLLGDYPRSAEYLAKAVAAGPDNIEALYYLGRVRFTQNYFEEAMHAFQEVLKRDPGHVKAWNNVGQVLEAQNDIDGAIAAYRRAVELDAASPQPSEYPLLNLGVLLMQRNQVAEALSLLRRASGANPASAQVRSELGKLYVRLGRLADAERELVEATRLDPQDVGAHYQLGRVYHRLGKKELARQELELTERLRQKRR